MTRAVTTRPIPARTARPPSRWQRDRAAYAPLLAVRHNCAMPRRDDRNQFRSSDFTEPDTFRKRSRAPRTDTQPQVIANEGQRFCSRGQWCASSVIITEGGETRREPALGPRSFCDRDRGHVERCLEEIPEQYACLAAELGNPSS